MKKVFKAGICTMAAVMLLAGCSAKDNTTTTGAETLAEGESTAAVTESTTPLETEAHVAESSVKLGNYKGLAVTVTEAKVTDEEIDAQIEQILTSNAEPVEVERAAKDGDIVNIDYKGLLDGKEFEGGSAQGHDLELGSNSFIEGFEAGLIGAKKGEKKDLNLKFPEGYQNADLSGKDVVFQVTVNTVSEMKTPELTDEFVKGLSAGGSTVAELKNTLREDLLEQKKYEIERQRNMDLIEAILAESEITCATERVDAEYETQLKSYTDQAAMYGVDLATMAGMYGMDENGFKNEIRTMAKDIVKQKLMYEEIAKAEKITATDEDKLELAKANSFDTVDALVAAYGQELVDDATLSQKVLDFLVENAKITVSDGAEAEATQASEESKAQ